jgi:hypothetical protein
MFMSHGVSSDDCHIDVWLNIPKISVLLCSASARFSHPREAANPDGCQFNAIHVDSSVRTSIRR